MKKFRINEKFEIGQTLPFIVLMIFVILGMVALVLDGGSVMANRRTAQVAADSAAMAGAQRACYGYSDAVAVAEAYAANNGATMSSVSVSGTTVTVEATVENPSFFAKVFGDDTLTAVADASAGCFAPQGVDLMPVAWSCRSTVTGGPFDEGKDCQIMSLDWDNLLEPLVTGQVSTISIPGNTGLFKMAMDGTSIVNTSTGEPASQIYILMDKIASNTDIVCKEDLDPSDPAYSSAITCDVDGDGKNDIEGFGNKGWLDLDGGGGGAGDTRDWIRYGFDDIIEPHTWLAGEPGTEEIAYKTMKNYRLGDVVLIPVFNAICDAKDPLSNAACMAAAHADPFPPEPPTGDIAGSGHKPNFHIITFAPFYISCVHEKQHDTCPGFELAQNMNLVHGNSYIQNNTPSVEGYFLENITLALDIEQSCDINLGNCTVSLTD